MSRQSAGSSWWGDGLRRAKWVRRVIVATSLVISVAILWVGLNSFCLWRISPRLARSHVKRLVVPGFTQGEIHARLGMPESVMSPGAVEAKYGVRLNASKEDEVWVYELHDLAVEILFVVFDRQGRVRTYHVH